MPRAAAGVTSTKPTPPAPVDESFATAAVMVTEQLPALSCTGIVPASDWPLCSCASTSTPVRISDAVSRCDSCVSAMTDGIGDRHGIDTEIERRLLQDLPCRGITPA